MMHKKVTGNAHDNLYIHIYDLVDSDSLQLN